MTHALVLAAALKILTIGNSFSLQMVRAMPPIARDLGLELDICSLYIGGCSLERHCRNVAAPETKPYSVTRNRLGESQKKFKGNIPDMLKADKWDIVTIQQASPKSWKYETYQPYADDLIKTIRELAPQAEIVVHETWSYGSGEKRLKDWGIDEKTMYSSLHDAYSRLAGKYGFRVIPTGTAAENFPNRDCLFKDIHFNANGDHLQALVWTAKLFGADVTRCRFVPKGVDQELAKTMRKVAQETVTKDNK